MTPRPLIAFILPLLGAAALVGVAAASNSEPSDAGKDAAQVERGKYLVTVSVCNDCHTPFKMGENGPEPDMSRMLSGHPADMELPPPPAPVGPWIASFTATNTGWSGPWGISYSANITPDDETGIGKWTYENFRDTIRNGRHMGRGRQILPPMPWPMFRHMTDEDLAAIFAYLQTVPAISNKVPEPQPPAAAP
jgi:mono/diheme cytochrome c family protein